MQLLTFLALICICLFIILLVQYLITWSTTAVPYEVVVGRATWLALHAMADHFPLNPTAEEKLAATNMIAAFALLYPCVKCRGHMQEYIKKNPLRCKTRIQIVMWLFDFHNAVNRRLGKPVLEHVHDRFAQYTAPQPRLDLTSLNAQNGQCHACSQMQ